ncbi:hypothetical protein Dimus_027779 [Dionaea muscipula]
MSSIGSRQLRALRLCIVFWLPVMLSCSCCVPQLGGWVIILTRFVVLSGLIDGNSFRTGFSVFLCVIG